MPSFIKYLFQNNGLDLQAEYCRTMGKLQAVQPSGDMKMGIADTEVSLT